MEKNKSSRTYNEPHGFNQPTKCISWNVSATHHKKPIYGNVMSDIINSNATPILVIG